MAVLNEKFVNELYAAVVKENKVDGLGIGEDGKPYIYGDIVIKEDQRDKFVVSVCNRNGDEIYRLGEFKHYPGQVVVISTGKHLRIPFEYRIGE